MEEPSAPPPTPRPARAERAPLRARLFGGGARGARRVARVAGVERAVGAATEEAIVRAVESQAVERALARVLQGPTVEEAMRGALQSPAVERALIDAVDSELVDVVWRRILASDEAQKLVERIAEAPEVRAAIASQGVGFLDDMRRQIARVARRLDDAIERAARSLVLRRRRPGRSECAGACSRLLAFAIDVGVLNAIFFALSAVAALITSLLLPGDATAPALAVGVVAWLMAGGVYLLAFWSLIGQTPGMRFLGLRLVAVRTGRLTVIVALRRLVGFALAAIPLGAGFLGILFSNRRRALDDAIAGIEVRYESLERQAPWSGVEPAPPR